MTDRPLPIPRRSPVSWRSLLTGLVLASFVALFTPWNDYVLNNTPVIGSALPTGVVLFILCLSLLNSVLRRWRTSLALTSGELAVVLAIGLVACSVPAGGFMRYFVGNVIGIQNQAGQDGRYRQALREADLPGWLFPAFTTPLELRNTDPVVSDYVGRMARDDDSVVGYVRAIPWGAWVTPLLTWGLFVAMLAAAVLAMAVLVRRQWVENERLPFPLASIYLRLIETPPAGRWLNPTLGARAFWLAAGGVFFVHLLAGLHVYWPRYVPELAMRFDLSRVLANGPWGFVENEFKSATIVFSVVGITFFLSQKVAFSLWFFYVVLQLTRIGYGQYQADFSADMQRDQLFGAVFPYAGAMLYVGRHHLLAVGRRMVGVRRAGDPTPRYLSDSVAGWTLVAAFAGMVLWLVVAGVSLVPAVCLVGLMLVFFVVIARVVAETGMPYAGLYLPLTMPFTAMVAAVPDALATKVTTRDFLLGAWLGGLFAHDHRESLPAYATHALRVADQAMDHPPPELARRTDARALLPTMAGTLVVAFVLSFAAWMLVEHRYAGPIDRYGGSTLLNDWPTMHQPMYVYFEPTIAYQSLTPESHQAHWRGGHMALGAMAMTVLSTLRLRYEAFPLHPVGYLMGYTLALKWVWFSVFLGWMAKGLVLKLGGAALLGRISPLFVGLIIGEACSAVFWMFFNVVRYAMGLEFVKVQLLPG